jgi:hypothetical protein
MDIAEEGFTRTIYFQLSPVDTWPIGQYKVDLYLNSTFAQMAEFSNSPCS